MPKSVELKLIKAKVAPADQPWGDGIVADTGGIRPFIVERSWSGPAGHYAEHWTMRRDGQVVVDGPRQVIFVRGMQSVRTFQDVVEAPSGMGAGSYELVFTVDGRFMGSVPIVVKQGAAA